MTATPFHDIATRARAAAIKGVRLHLDLDHARALALNPEMQALLGRLVAQETEKLCRAEPIETDNPHLPWSSEPLPSPMMTATPPPAACESAPPARSYGSNGAPIASNTSLPGTIAPLVQDAASQQDAEQALSLIHI